MLSLKSAWIPPELMEGILSGSCRCKKGASQKVLVFFLTCKRGSAPCWSLLGLAGSLISLCCYLCMGTVCKFVKRLFSFWVEIRCLFRHPQGIYVPNLSLSHYHTYSISTYRYIMFLTQLVRYSCSLQSQNETSPQRKCCFAVVFWAYLWNSAWSWHRILKSAPSTYPRNQKETWAWEQIVLLLQLLWKLPGCVSRKKERRF